MVRNSNICEDWMLTRWYLYHAGLASINIEPILNPKLHKLQLLGAELVGLQWRPFTHWKHLERYEAIKATNCRSWNSTSSGKQLVCSCFSTCSLRRMSTLQHVQNFIIKNVRFTPTCMEPSQSLVGLSRVEAATTSKQRSHPAVRYAIPLSFHLTACVSITHTWNTHNTYEQVFKTFESWWLLFSMFMHDS